MVDDEAGPKYTPEYRSAYNYFTDMKRYYKTLHACGRIGKCMDQGDLLFGSVSSVIATCKLPNRVTYESNYEPR